MENLFNTIQLKNISNTYDLQLKKPTLKPQ